MASLLVVTVSNVEAAVITGVTDKVSPQYIKASSDPVAIFGFNATADAGETLAWVNITFTGTNWDTGDLLPLDTDSSVSGVGLYNDSYTAGVNDDVLDTVDTSVMLAGNVWVTVGGDYCNMTTTEALPASVTGSYHWFVVIRTSATIGNGDTIGAMIEGGNIGFSDGSSQPALSVPADAITVDTIKPIVEAGSDEVKNAPFSSTNPADRVTIASASDTGSGIDTSRYFWSEGTGNVWWSDSHALTTDIWGNVDGSYTIRLNAFDNAGNWWSDVAGLIYDATPPTVIAAPANMTIDVATNVKYVLEFSEAMNTSVGSCLIEPTPAGGSWAWDGTGMWYNYTGAAWAESTRYWVNLTNFEDLITNSLTGDDQFWFRTGDFTSPTITSTIPSDTLTDVSTAAWTYIFQFSEPINTSANLDPLSDLPGVSWSWNGNQQLEGTYSALAETTTYYVECGGRNFQDLAGLTLSGDMHKNFTTGDFTNPTAVPTPADLATGVVTALGTYSILFSEPMQAVGTLATDTIPSGAWGWTDNTHYEKTGIGALVEVTTYDVVLNADFLDIAGNPVTGDITFDFTTGGSPTATPDPADSAIDVSIMQNYTLEFSEPMNTGVFPSIEPTPPDPANASWAWDGTGMWCNYTYTGPGGPPFLWNPATKYWVNLTGIVDVDDGWGPSDTHFNFTIDVDPPVVYNLTCSPTTSVSFYNNCHIDAKINDTGSILVAPVMFLMEAGGNATLDNYTELAMFDQGTGVSLTPTADANITNLSFTWNATSPLSQTMMGWGLGGYISDGTVSDYLCVGYWENGTGAGFIGVSVYYTNVTTPPTGNYDKVEAELQFYANGTINGLWINETCSHSGLGDWVNPSQFNNTMTIIPRVNLISFNSTTGELVSTPGVSVYGEYGHEYSLPDVSFVRDYLVPNGDYPWFVFAMDGGMNMGFNMSETPVSVDNTQPTASTTPANGATNITTVAGNYTIHFSEPMNTTAGSIEHDLPNATWTWSPDGRWFNTSYNALEGGKRYEFLLGPFSKFKDLAGNPLPDAEKNKNFTTGKPWATATGPVSTGTNNNTPTITYDFGNNATEVGIYTTNDGGITWKNWDYDDTVDGIWVPTGAAAAGVGPTGTYQWSVRACGSIVGVDEPVPSGAASIECGDYVLDMKGPMITSTMPANWVNDVNRAAGTYVIEFDEEMDTSVGTVLSTLPGISSWDWDSTGMWLNGTYTDLAAETTYYVNLTGQGFVDLVGNALTGQSDMEFKTERGPWADAGWVPPDGTTNPRPWVGYSSNNRTTSVEIYYTDDGGTTWTLWGEDTNHNGTFIPASDLPAAGTYNWNARALGYIDEPVPSGVASIESGDYVLLSTADTACITSTTPADGATSVGINAGTYIIRFNRAMNDTGSPLSDLPGVTWTWSGNGMWLNGTYNALSVSTTYYVNLTGQGFQSATGSLLIGDMYRVFTTRAANETATGTVTGQVTDEDGNPIAGVTVTIPGTDITAMTDENGWYVLEGVPEGEHTLEISHPDYGTQEVDVSVNEGETETAETEQLPPPGDGGGDWTWIIIILIIVVAVVIVGVLFMLKGKGPKESKPSFESDAAEETAELEEPLTQAKQDSEQTPEVPPPEK